jgi:hypothetical protein
MGVYTTIDKSSDHFLAKTYTGTHSSVPTVSIGFKSDWLWLKSRTQTYDHAIFDTSRGGSKYLGSQDTSTENTSGDSVTFNATTFQPSGQSINEAGQGADNMISWNWKCNGGTTSTNTDGATNGYNTTVQANQTAGFSIVQWNAAFDQGNGRYNLGHGLGKIADFIIIKNRDNTGDWYVHHPNIDDNDYLRLNLNNATSNTGARYTFYRPAFTTSIFNVDYNNIVTQNHNYIAYVFATIQGFSKFDSYTGNGSTNGPFVYTGFKPAWLMIKRIDSANNWYIFDNNRDSYQNPFADIMEANSNVVENADTGRGDFLSNGFKILSSAAAFNADNGVYIYAAFAENPFVSSTGVPTTAK